jgi:hypothetical protein
MILQIIVIEKAIKEYAAKNVGEKSIIEVCQAVN